MGCLVWPTSLTSEENGPNPASNDTRPITKYTEEGTKPKFFKNQQKPPRFMKLERAEANTDKFQRNCEEEYAREVPPQRHPQQPQQPQIAHQQIPVAIPYAPQYTVQYPTPYPVPGYPIQSVQEPVPVEPAPISTVSYSEHSPRYIEPSYTIPYMMYTHPQYYYSN